MTSLSRAEKIKQEGNTVLRGQLGWAGRMTEEPHHVRPAVPERHTSSWEPGGEC